MSDYKVYKIRKRNDKRKENCIKFNYKQNKSYRN